MNIDAIVFIAFIAVCSSLMYAGYLMGLQVGIDRGHRVGFDLGKMVGRRQMSVKDVL